MNPGEIIQASDRRYIVSPRGELRVLDYQPAPIHEVIPEGPELWTDNSDNARLQPAEKISESVPNAA